MPFKILKVIKMRKLFGNKEKYLTGEPLCVGGAVATLYRIEASPLGRHWANTDITI